MKVALVVLLVLASALAWKIPPPMEKQGLDAAANATVSSLIVNTLQATQEFSNEAHNGIGWTSVYIAPGTNYFCSLTYTQSWAQQNIQTGCMVLYQANTNQYFLQAFSGAVGTSSWCKARCIRWS